MRLVDRLLVLVVVLSACTPTPAPSASQSSTPSRQATQQPSPPDLPTTTPSLTPTLQTACRALPDDFEVPTVAIYGDIGTFGAEFGVQEVVPHEHPDFVFTGTPVVREASPETLPAGQVLGLDLWLNYVADRDRMRPIAVESVEVTLTLPDRAPISLPVTIEPGNVGLVYPVVAGIPDVDAIAIFELTVVWSDRCFRYTARDTLENVTLQSTATIGHCPMDDDAYYDYVRGLMAAPLHVGSGTVDLGSPSHRARYAPFENPGIDAFAAYFWDPEAPAIRARPGERLLVESGSPLLDLEATGGQVWTRRSVAEAIADYPPDGLVVVDRGALRQIADSTARLRVPDVAGRYVAALGFAFTSACSTGEAWAVFSLTVTEPGA